MICQNCGKDNIAGNRYCGWCGRDMMNINPPSPALESQTKIVKPVIATKKARKALWPYFLLFFVIVITGVEVTKLVKEFTPVPETIPQWEYMKIEVPNEGTERSGADAVKYATISVNLTRLNELGSQGWELVNSFLEMETAFPNLGDPKYVYGFQPNVRPQRVVLIFKRKVIKKKK